MLRQRSLGGWSLAAGPLLVVALAGCGEAPPAPAQGTPGGAESAAPPVSAAAPQAVPAAPRPLAADPNPLGLPPRTLEAPAGTPAFAVPEPMLRGAKLGSSLALHAAEIVGSDGDLLVVQTREGAPYKVHPGYVLLASGGARRPGVGDPVIVEWAGVLRHGVLRAHKKDRPVVRLFDASDTADRTLEDAILLRAEDGFRPGNYAAARVSGELAHVLLVSPLEGEPRRWLALGHAGAARIVDELALSAIPVRWEPKEGAAVLVESLGTMRRGTIQSIDRPGLYSVKLERAGRPVVVGWGMLMPPFDGPR